VLIPAGPKSRLRDFRRCVRAYVRRVGRHLSDAAVDKICDGDYDAYRIAIPDNDDKGTASLKGVHVPRYDLRDSDYILEGGGGGSSRGSSSSSSSRGRSNQLTAIVIDLCLKYASEYRPERERFEQRLKSMKRKLAIARVAAKDEKEAIAAAKNGANGDLKSHGNGSSTRRRHGFGGDSMRAGGGMSIYDCLDLFVKPERLSDGWKCPKCKTQRKATKRFGISKLPRVLVVHFKRFRFTQMGSRKIDTMVDFPTHGLDISGYLVQGKSQAAPKANGSSSCSSSSSSSNGAPSTPSPGNERGVYDLYAVSNHSGSLGFGHYTAYAKTEGGQWYNFDDSIVSKMPKGAPVQSKASYLLFYKKRGE